MINEKIEKALVEMKNLYEKIFKVIRPRIDSTGYTERNQTCNFVTAFLQGNPNAVAWYEFPLNDKRSHIDAIIYDERDNTFYLVEAKRYNSDKKVESIINDFVRCCKSQRKVAEICFKGMDYPECNYYVVILADLWKERKKYWESWGEETDDLRKKIMEKSDEKAEFCSQEFTKDYMKNYLEEYRLLCIYAETTQLKFEKES